MNPVFKAATIDTVNEKEFDADGALRFVASTESVDRYGDIVRQDGWDLKQYRSNPVILFSHQQAAPVGIATRVWVEAKKLMVDLKLAAAGTSELVDSVRALVSQRILRAVSVGFLPHEAKELQTEGRFAGYEFIKQELLEISLVAVPANADAVAVARSLKISDDMQRRLFVPASKGISAARARVDLEKLRASGM